MWHRHFEIISYKGISQFPEEYQKIFKEELYFKVLFKNNWTTFVCEEEDIGKNDKHYKCE
jgi:hypothetical protein